ncbi:uncharacterized protein LOC124670258 [Lolium rigidum]|uniref:uncharacterized protein LOC124670258 n=1 Tax=Lolium rigidum TaxID=89674 RepID=UPI001F5DBD1C|nr:uncharacterized protein LOC124670258 [Lolium rigidum]
MPSSSSPILIRSDTESDDDDAAALSMPAAECFASSLCTQAEVDALCEKHGVPREFGATPAGDRRACTPPPPGSVCVYAHALETGLRFPLHPFFSEVLSHFGVAPGQLTPNGWRVLVGFVVLCHTTDVPPSLAVFRHFFALSRKGWCFFRCKQGVGALFTGIKGPKSGKKWKRGFFFLSSPVPWSCPVRWYEEPPCKISTKCPVLSSQDNKSVAKLAQTYGAGVDLRAYLSEADLGAAFSSHLVGTSPPPPLQPSPRSTGSQGMGLPADEAVAPAEKVKAEPVSCTPQLPGKKRKQDEVASAKAGLCRSELGTPPAAPNRRHLPVPDTQDGASADWEEARNVLDRIIPPWRQREFAAAKTSDVVASSFVAILQAVNHVSYSLNHALELEQKQRAHERDVAALREQLAEVKAERKNAKAELAAARQATAAEVEIAKTAAVQQFLRSKEYTRRVAEQALPAYERGAEDMKRVALRLNPRLDAAKLLLPLD